jgi:peroxiredoxin
MGESTMLANRRNNENHSNLLSITSEYARHDMQSFLEAPSHTPDRLHSTAHLASGFSLPSTDGQLLRLSDYRGSRVILAFCATWGRLCQSQLPTLARLARESGVVVLAIFSGEAPHAVEDYVTEHDITFPVLNDADSEIKRRYDVTCLPMTFYIDEQGHVADFHRGEVDEDTLNHWLASVSPVGVFQ